MKIPSWLFLIIGALCLYGVYNFMNVYSIPKVSEEYQKEISEFRTQSEAKLRAPQGWLSVVGLHWLKEGEQTIGSDETNHIVLPTSVPKQLGLINYKKTNEKNKTQFLLKDLASGAKIKSGAVASPLGDRWVDLQDDTQPNPTTLEVNDVQFFPIERAGKMGLRVKHENAKTRLEFVGKKWYPPNPKYVIEGDWIHYDTPKKIMVPDILGHETEETATGHVEFQLGEESLSLTPTESGDQLFFVFKDKTSGKDTYGAARFLYTSKPKDGKVILDFNKAVNPPCAFTAFATCPLPLKENQLQVAIEAGELKTH